MVGTAHEDIHVRSVELAEITRLREAYRSASRCQIVHDSILGRGLADPYVLDVGEDTAGYAGVWNEHFPDRILEFFAFERFRARTPDLVRALAARTGATELEVQTNLEGASTLIDTFVGDPRTEKLLFHAVRDTQVDRPDLTFRRRVTTDRGPEGAWVIDRNGEVVGAGGWLTHYNPPYADVYMEVAEHARRQGIGTFLVQELRRACSNEGYLAAARCDPSNQGSRRTLERAGFEVCGALVVGRIPRPDTPPPKERV